jgi:hypothetical protein
VDALIGSELRPGVSEKNFTRLITGWQRLFRTLARDATNLQRLQVYWDHEGYVHPGLGKNPSFVRALARLKVQQSIKLEGYYAQPWPEYLERKMGLRPLMEGEDAFTVDQRRYQRGTEGLLP